MSDEMKTANCDPIEVEGTNAASKEPFTEEREVLSVRKYKAGYEVKTEKITWQGMEPFVMKSAYNPEGHYIGNSKNAYRLCKKRGIKPILSQPSHKVCSIGFCEKENKWYGWSHRAMYGFTIGSKVKKGDCGYRPIDPQDMLEDMKRFWINDWLYEDEKEPPVTPTKIIKENIVATDPKIECNFHVPVRLGVLLETERIRIKDDEVLHNTHWYPYPDVWGKGEWTAKTMEDAKEMAIDFANGVS